MNAVYWIKYLVFLVTPHLLFDRIAYWLAKVDKHLLESLQRQDNVYVFLACDYPNLGDYAITKAQAEMLERMYSERRVFLFGYDDTYSSLKTVLRCHKTSDIVTIIGGGNMGELYYGFERKRNFIVERMQEYRIISFPQSVVFNNTAFGRLAFRRSVSSYRKHPRLTMLFREKMSFQRMKNASPEINCYLVPDIVMTLNCRTATKRTGVILSLRNDKESYLTDDQRSEIRSLVRSRDKHALEIDTCIKADDNLELSFQKLIRYYQNAGMVITDRLHGMIFAFITGTPAIVLPNNNGKIEHSYDWISECGYICFLRSVETFPEVFRNFAKRNYTESYADFPKSMQSKFDFLLEA